MKAAPFKYLAARSVDEAVSLLAEHGDQAKILAGGQSLLPMMNMRLAAPEVLVDVSRISELRGSSVQAASRQRYGACTLHSDLEDARVEDVTNGLLRAAAGGIGYRAIRNRGTLGGSLAHADPSAEWPVVMAALDAQVLARSARGERMVDCREMFKTYFTTCLEDDELLTEILVATLSPNTRWGLCKSARKIGEFADSMAVAIVKRDGDKASEARVWLGGAHDVPLQLPRVERAITESAGRSLSQDDVVQLVVEELGAARDSDETYRRHLHAVTTWRATRDALSQEDRWKN